MENNTFRKPAKIYDAEPKKIKNKTNQTSYRLLLWSEMRADFFPPGANPSKFDHC